MKAKLSVPAVSSGLKRKRRAKKLARITQAMRSGHFSQFELPPQTVEELDEVKKELHKAKKHGIIEQETFERCHNIIEQSKVERNITEEDQELLLKTYGRLTSQSEQALQDLKQSVKASSDKSRKDLTKSIVDEIRKKQNREPREIIEDFILKEEEGKYLSQLAQILYYRWGEEFKYHEVHQMIETLEDKKRVETIGGQTKGKKRRVYPSVESEQWRELRDGKEVKLNGEVEEDITDHFQNIRGRTDIHIQEFHYGQSNRIYVATKEKLPSKKNLTSIGRFYKDSLYTTMMDNFGYKLKPDYEGMGYEDSQIALFVRGNNFRWLDESNPRAKEIAA